jgi:hypothetical protein
MSKTMLHFSIDEKEYSILSLALLEYRMLLKKESRGEKLQETIWKIEQKISTQLNSQKHSIVNIQEIK